MSQKKGLRVKWCKNVFKCNRSSKGVAPHIVASVPDAWRIQVWRGDAWAALMDLRFLREKDAIRAAHALTVAGLNTIKALQKADPLTVRQVACEFLQW